MHATLTIGLLISAGAFELRESEISYCTDYGNLCNPDFSNPCCNQSLICSITQPEGKYRCINQVGLGESCKYDSECKTILWHAHCSNKIQKCVCRSDAIQVDSRCEALIGGYCIHGEQCTAENSICSNSKCKCSYRFLPVAHNMCIKTSLGVPCIYDQTCFGVKNAVCLNNHCSCREDTMVVNSTMCGKFLDESCSHDDDCGPQNSICVENKCHCEENFSREDKTHCNPPQLKMTCKTYADCRDSIKHSFCSEENQCECFPSYFPINETACVPYLESYCSDSDPCRLENSVCIKNVCQCAPHHDYIEFRCKPIYSNSSCRSDEDCTEIQKAICSDDDKTCVCEPNHERVHELLCAPLLDEYCDQNTKCATDNAVCYQNQCKCDVYFSPDSNNRCLPTLLKQFCTLEDDCQRIENAVCLNKMCLCQVNYVELNDLTCTPFVGEYCNSNEDCFLKLTKCIKNKCVSTQPVELHPNEKHPSSRMPRCKNNDDCHSLENAICSTNGTCTCKPNHTSLAGTICLPLLNESCLNYFCAVKNSFCYKHKCKCLHRYDQQSNDKCLPTWLNEQCENDTDCQKIENAVCSPKKTCVCKKFYFQFSDTKCTSLTAEFCRRNSDCPVPNSACIDSFCQCRPNYEKAWNHQCIPRNPIKLCSLNRHCDDIDNAFCSSDGKCTCKPEFVGVNNSMCLTRLRETCNTDYDCNKQNSFCFQGQCLCRLNYIIYEDQCVPNSLGTPCRRNSDCGRIFNAVCSNSNRCVCKLTHYAIDRFSCAPKIGVQCLSHSDCHFENSECYEKSTCQCRRNYFSVSEMQCLPRSGMPSCYQDLDCGEPWSSNCSTDGKCTCKRDNLLVNKSTCSPLIGGPCWADHQCRTQNSFCRDFHCVCKENYYAVSNNLCVKIN